MTDTGHDQKIQDLIDSSKKHHSYQQHQLVLLLFGLYQAHSLALTASKPVHLNTLQATLTDCWADTANRAASMSGLKLEEYEEITGHLLSLIDAFNVYRSKLN